MALAIEDKKDTPSLSKERLINALFFFLLGLAIFGALWFSVKNNAYLTRFDQPVLDWMVAHRTDTLTIVMQTITNIASPVGFIGIVGVGAVLWGLFKKEIWRPVLLLGAMGASFVISTIIKTIVHRGRPPMESMIKPFETDYSFPSGHTIGIAVCLFVLSYLIYSREPRFGKLIWLFLVTIVGIGAVAVSRLYLGYHWVTDVTASIGLAFIVLAIVIVVDYIFERTIKK